MFAARLDQPPGPAPRSLREAHHGVMEALGHMAWMSRRPELPFDGLPACTDRALALASR